MVYIAWLRTWVHYNFIQMNQSCILVIIKGISWWTERVAQLTDTSFVSPPPRSPSFCSRSENGIQLLKIWKKIKNVQKRFVKVKSKFSIFALLTFTLHSIICFLVRSNFYSWFISPSSSGLTLKYTLKLQKDCNPTW